MALKSYEELIKVDVRQYCEETEANGSEVFRGTLWNKRRV